MDFWFYDATVDLFSDLDFDGYYFGIDLTFDATTLFDGTYEALLTLRSNDPATPLATDLAGPVLLRGVLLRRPLGEAEVEAHLARFLAVHRTG